MIKVSLTQGDITDQKVDAVVNAANNHLWMGSGVAGAIKSRGGREIEDEAVGKGPVAVGEAVITGAGRLPARWVIHAAVMGQDLRTDFDKIKLATANALARAAELGVASVAFPALGTGVGGFPLREAARAMKEAMDLADIDLEVKLVLFENRVYNEFARVFAPQGMA